MNQLKKINNLLLNLNKIEIIKNRKNKNLESLELKNQMLKDLNTIIKIISVLFVLVFFSNILHLFFDFESIKKYVFFLIAPTMIIIPFFSLIFVDFSKGMKKLTSSIKFHTINILMFLFFVCICLVFLKNQDSQFFSNIIIFNLLGYILFMKHQKSELNKDKYKNLESEQKNLEEEYKSLKESILQSNEKMIILTSKELIDKSDKLQRGVAETLIREYKDNYFKDKNLNIFLKSETKKINNI